MKLGLGQSQKFYKRKGREGRRETVLSVTDCYAELNRLDGLLV